MDKSIKLTEKFFEVIKNEGVVSIVSWGIDEPHVVNTWNSYLVITEDGKILIPAFNLFLKKPIMNLQILNPN